MYYLVPCISDYDTYIHLWPLVFCGTYYFWYRVTLGISLFRFWINLDYMEAHRRLIGSKKRIFWTECLFVWLYSGQVPRLVYSGTETMDMPIITGFIWILENPESPGKRVLVLESSGNLFSSSIKYEMSCWQWGELTLSLRKLRVLEKFWKFVFEKGYEPCIKIACSAGVFSVHKCTLSY